MNPYKTALDLRTEGVDEEVIACVIAISALHVNKKVELRHYSSPNLYSKELELQCRELLWETNGSVFDAAWRLIQLGYDYELSHSFDGLGGCVAKTYRELYFEGLK